MLVERSLEVHSSLSSSAAMDSPHAVTTPACSGFTQAAHSALGTGDVTGSAELKQVTGHWSDSRQAVTGVSPVTRCFVCFST